MNKVERLKASLRNVREKGAAAVKNVIHAAEYLGATAATAYAEGRMSDDTGEWGFRGVPYAYMGGGALLLVGFLAGDRYGADAFALGAGTIGGHLGRTMYETGLKSKTSTSGRSRQLPQQGHDPMGLESALRNAAAANTQRYGTSLDALRGVR